MDSPDAGTRQDVPRRTVVVVGVGNVGSHLVPHLARMPGIAHVVVIDKGRYEQANVRTQDITPGGVDKRKAQVQAHRLRRINPRLTVSALADAVEDVPLTRLRADVILACVDSRVARQYLNQAAWHLGVPWIDSGVQPDGLLARVAVYRPARDRACMECTWDQADYDVLETSYACQAETAEPVPTNAPAQLGALAASVQAIECQRLLAGDAGHLDDNHEIVLDAASHRQHVTAFRRNPMCPIVDHEPRPTRTLGASALTLTLPQALALAEQAGSNGEVALWVEGVPFVTGLSCLTCGRKRALLRLRRALRPGDRTCDRCGGRLVAVGADLADRLDAGALPGRARSRSLRSLGIRPGDVFGVGGPQAAQFFEIAVERQP